ncbi:HyaD/HybD family hydrogenase maturation endopeptidase [Geobacter sulfurreducens]|uniref:HyaD/HybD family hydrogenase maturation endopeptidase n=1 Tax=Geobacter sulfurreducens TaxID=35554 RepID=UPI000E64C2E8|nr:HyaD/HybD family hydrogenase maturation endopeptidase [Geobacter sulfurreducens]
MSILVLGIGNLIMSDDGAGVRAVELIRERHPLPAGVTLLDGGTLGLDLLPRLDGVDRLLVVDAIDTGAPAGTLVRLEGEDIPAALRTKVSPHQMGLQDLLAVADLQGNLPGEMVLWGIQYCSVEPGTDLSAPVSRALPLLVDQVLAELAAWGIHPV